MGRGEEAEPEVHLDCCLLGKRDETAQPAMAVRDRDTRMTLSFLTRGKGAADKHVINSILCFMKETGHMGKGYHEVRPVLQHQSRVRQDSLKKRRPNYHGALASQIVGQ